MGLIQAAVGALGGALADQWVDFYTVPQWLSQTAAVFPAVPKGTNAGRGSNIRASEAIITNGSRIVVPEGYGLITFQDGQITSLVTTPGAYIWDSENIESRSVFIEGNIYSLLVEQSWQRFKYGGRPSSQQVAIFVSLKELPSNKFGTQTPIYWDDPYLHTQAGATTRGTYTLKIVDPILFTQKLLPASFLQNGEVFDFTDPDNEVASQLFNEVVASLAPALSSYTNNIQDPKRISDIQRDSIGFSASLSSAVEYAFKWTVDRGISIAKVAIIGIDYNEETKELLKTVQRADALQGTRGDVNLQASIASGIEKAGQADGGAGILGIGLAAGTMGISQFNQKASLLEVENKMPSPRVENSLEQSVENNSEDLILRLQQLKRALDAGLINQSEFEKAKEKALGI